MVGPILVPALKDAGGKGALFLRKPLGCGLDGCGKVAGLAEPKQKTHQAETDDGSGDHADILHPAGSAEDRNLDQRAGDELRDGREPARDRRDRHEEVTERRKSPDNDGHGVALLRADAVNHAACKQQAHGIGAGKDADDHAILHLGEANSLHRILQDRAAAAPGPGDPCSSGWSRRTIARRSSSDSG